MAKKNQTRISYPKARDENVVVEAVGDETVIYDLDTHVAHALKPLASAVYAYADGKNTVAEIAELASYRLATTVTEADAEDALAQLEAISMLSAPLLDVSTGVSRRTALKTFAAAGAGSMLVLSIATSAASACYTCTAAPGYSSTWGNPNESGNDYNIACTTTANPGQNGYNFGSNPGPGDCQLCQSSSFCGSGQVCCCTPCDNGTVSDDAAYCCQPVCFYRQNSSQNGGCPTSTIPLSKSLNGDADILCPPNYVQSTYNPTNQTTYGVKCCEPTYSAACPCDYNGVCGVYNDKGTCVAANTYVGTNKNTAYANCACDYNGACGGYNDKGVCVAVGSV